MRVLIIDFGRMELREVAEINLQTLQDAVGGLIQPIFTVPSLDRHDHEVTGYCNEEGGPGLLNLTPNVWCAPHMTPICGPIVITALNDDGDSAECTDAEFEQIGITAPERRDGQWFGVLHTGVRVAV